MNKCGASEAQLRHLQIFMYLSVIAHYTSHLFNMLVFYIRTVQPGVRSPVPFSRVFEVQFSTRFYVFELRIYFNIHN
jgi:hypothetical protein